MEIKIFDFVLTQDMIFWGSLIFCLVGFIFALIAMILAIRVSKRSKRILRDGAGKDITEAIITYYKKCTEIMNDYKSAEARLQKLESDNHSSIKKVGSVRYNAFGDTGGNLSFAVALLNEEDTGIVLNGVYSRQQTNTYLKPIKKGTSLFELSEEEEEAIRAAKINFERAANKM